MTTSPVNAGWVNTGGRGYVPDATGYEAGYPVKAQFSRAGVIGGIPNITSVKATLSPGDNIQAAIDNGGPGVVLLNAGTYVINSAINLKSDVILRGVNRDTVILSVRMTSTTKVFAFQFNSTVRYAGIERLTISYDATTNNPIDHSALDNVPFDAVTFENDPYGITNLYVGSVSIQGTNNWADQVQILNSGTDPVRILGNHITFRNSFIDRCYNKGGGGNGYFDVRGDWNFVAGNTIKRIRHFAVNIGARYNVVMDNLIQGDVNFHNGDAGQNLIERNEVYRPSWHKWRCFGTGGAIYGHEPPGPNNMIFNNTCFDYYFDYSPCSDTNTIYTYLTYGEPTNTTWPYPSRGTFHVVKTIPSPWSAGDVGWNGKRGLISYSSGSWSAQAAGSGLADTSDGFYFVWQPVVGDCDIVVRVDSQQNTAPWAQAGVMIRESLAEGSRHVSHFVTPQNGARLRFRTTPAGSSTASQTDSGQSTPSWLRLTRTGNTFVASVKQTNAWVTVGSTTNWMWPRVYIGYFVSSLDTNTLANVSFSNVSINGTQSPNPVTVLDENFDSQTKGAVAAGFVSSVGGISFKGGAHGWIATNAATPSNKAFTSKAQGAYRLNIASGATGSADPNSAATNLTATFSSPVQVNTTNPATISFKTAAFGTDNARIFKAMTVRGVSSLNTEVFELWVGFSGSVTNTKIYQRGAADTTYYRDSTDALCTPGGTSIYTNCLFPNMVVTNDTPASMPTFTITITNSMVTYSLSAGSPVGTLTFPINSSATDIAKLEFVNLENQHSGAFNTGYWLDDLLVTGTVAQTPVILPPTTPVLAPVSNRTLVAGQWLLVTNTATDADVPAQTLTFSLPAAPAGALLNSTNGLLTWRPTLAQAPGTNLFTVTVTDSGTPPMSATQSFTATVVMPVVPQIVLPLLTNGLAQLTITGDSNLAYQLQASTNLSDWTTLLTTNAPALPFDWTDTNAGSFLKRFYRVILGP